MAFTYLCLSQLYRLTMPPVLQEQLVTFEMTSQGEVSTVTIN